MLWIWQKKEIDVTLIIDEDGSFKNAAKML